jgi:hypothetical protein
MYEAVLLPLERQREFGVINMYAEMHSLVKKLITFLVCYKITKEWVAFPDFTFTFVCGQKNKAANILYIMHTVWLV